MTAPKGTCPVPGWWRLESLRWTAPRTSATERSAAHRSSSSMFMWYVSASTRTPGEPAARSARRACATRVDHVVLVAVERLEQQHDARAPGVRAELREARDAAPRGPRSAVRGGSSNGGSRRVNMPHAAGVMTPPPPSAAMPSSWRRRSSSAPRAARGVEVARASRRAPGRPWARARARASRPAPRRVAQLERRRTPPPARSPALGRGIAADEVLLDREPITPRGRAGASSASTLAGSSTCSSASVVTPTTPARVPEPAREDPQLARGERGGALVDALADAGDQRLGGVGHLAADDDHARRDDADHARPARRPARAPPRARDAWRRASPARTSSTTSAVEADLDPRLARADAPSPQPVASTATQPRLPHVHMHVGLAGSRGCGRCRRRGRGCRAAARRRR